MTTTNDNPWLEADDTNDVSQVEPRTQPVRPVETPMAKATETVKEAPSTKKEPKAKPAVESPASSTPGNNNVRNSILVLSGVFAVAVGLMMFRGNETPAPIPAKTQNATVIKEVPATPTPAVEAPSVPAPVAEEPAPAPAPQVEAPTNSPLDKASEPTSALAPQVEAPANYPLDKTKEATKAVKTDTVQLPPPPPLPTLAKPVESGVASAKEAKDTKPRLVHLKSQPIVNKPDGWDEAERKMQEFAARQQALNPAR